VFYLTAALTLPALAALWPLRKVAIAAPIAPIAPGAAVGAAQRGVSKSGFLHVLGDRRLLIFGACAMLFTFANAPMLMLISGTMTSKVGNPSLLIAACIVLPQIIVALASPMVGRLADQRGRRIVLFLGFCVLPVRAMVFAFSSNPAIIVAVQALDGIGGACFGVMVPLIVSDVAARTRHFNLSLGFVGFGIGIGGTLSTPAAGWLADHFGTRLAFYGLAAVGIAATLLVLLAMPETRPNREEDPQ
jgi:MFS family permease